MRDADDALPEMFHGEAAELTIMTRAAYPLPPAAAAYFIFGAPSLRAASVI